MTFWVHSFRARRERDHAVCFKAQRDIAKAALAGWRFERIPIPRPYQYCYALWSPSGGMCGTNSTMAGAAAFALQEMELWANERR